MRSGVSQLTSFIYGERFREPQAQIAVAKASQNKSKKRKLQFKGLISLLI